jgi:hypothetical protein
VDLRLVSPHEADILRAKVALMLLDVFVALAWLRKLWSDWRSAVTPVIGVALLSRFLVHGGVMSALGDAWLDVVFIVALFWLLDFMTDGQKRRAGWVRAACTSVPAGANIITIVIAGDGCAAEWCISLGSRFQHHQWMRCCLTTRSVLFNIIDRVGCDHVTLALLPHKYDNVAGS